MLTTATTMLTIHIFYVHNFSLPFSFSYFQLFPLCIGGGMYVCAQATALVWRLELIPYHVSSSDYKEVVRLDPLAGPS